MKKKINKKSDNEFLVEKARRAINDMADDKSVSAETALENLYLLASDIECCVDGLENDIQKLGKEVNSK